MKYYFKLLSLPLSLLVFFISVSVVLRLFDLPLSDILAEYVGKWFGAYGLVALLISATIEGMLLFGGYFPGVFVIFVSVIVANSISEAITRIAVGTLGLFVAHIFNYLLGRYGWYRILAKFGLKSSIEEASNKLVKRGPIAIFSSYWMPSISALTDTAAGILQMPFKKFVIYSFLSMVFWNTLAGVMVYFVGNGALLLVGSGGTTELLIQFSVVAIWIIILLVIDFRKRRMSGGTDGDAANSKIGII